MSKKRARNEENEGRKRIKVGDDELRDECHSNSKELVWKLFDEGHTIPFLARYRKEQIGYLSADKLRHLFEDYEEYKQVQSKALKLKEKASKIGLLNKELKQCIESAKTLEEIESLAAPFKSTSKLSYANKARQLIGLEAAAQFWRENKPIKLKELSSQNGGAKIQIIEEHLGYLIADMVLHDFQVCQFINEKLVKDGRIMIESKCVGKKDKQKTFQNYHDFQTSILRVKSHQILAINRGEKKKELRVKVDIPDVIYRQLESFCLRQFQDADETRLKLALNEAYGRLVKPMIQRRIRASLTKKAELESLDVFADNLRQLLLTAPCRNSVIMGLDPGFKHGCKMAVIDAKAQVLETGVIYPTLQGSLNDKDENFLIKAVLKHKVDIIGIGTGTGSKEIEKAVVKLIANERFGSKSVKFTSVNEDGASIYSCSPQATQEFPNMDPNIISAISIARRLQDPLGEYVKIGPSHLGVGMYQHDVSESKLAKTLDAIVTECVSFVGVDLNLAPSFLLCHVSGITSAMAQKIIDWRSENGEFSSRSQLLKVRGIGAKTFEQCAGFVKILPTSGKSESDLNPLDATLIHPESYEKALKLLKAEGFSLDDIGSKRLMDHFQAKNGDQICEALAMNPFSDIRDFMPNQVLLKTRMISAQDLKIGQKVEGSVKNVTHFGAFVDVGVGRDALLHISQFHGKSIKLGQTLLFQILSIDKNLGRIGLKLDT